MTQNEGLKPAEEWARQLAKLCTPDKEPNAAIFVFKNFVSEIQTNAASHANASAIELVEKLLEIVVHYKDEHYSWACDSEKLISEAIAWLTAQKGE